MKKRAPSRLTWKKKLLFAFVPLVVLIAIIEIAARLIGSPDIPDSPYIDSAREMEWELRPNSETIWGRQKILVKTNSLGFRDKELGEAPAENEYRILFLGDSVVFGFELDQRDSLPTNLEKALGSAEPSKDFEVINAGLEGYNQLSSYYNLQYKGWQTKPKFILLGFVINDVYEPYTNMKRFGAKAQFIYGKKSLIREIKSWLRISAAYRLLEFQYLSHFVVPKANRPPYDFDHMYVEDEPPEINRAWKECLAELKRTKEAADEHGVPLMVVYFSTSWRLRPNEPGTQRPATILEEFADENRIAVFDFFPNMLEQPDPASLYQKGDAIHLSAEGNRLVAQWIAEVFEKADLMNKKPDEVYDAIAPWRGRLRDAIAAHTIAESDGQP